MEDRWQTLAPKPTAAGNVGAAMLGGLIYVVGGYDDALSDPYLDVVEAYDPAADSWSSLAPLPQPICGASVVAANGRLYVFGGSTQGGDLDTTYAYDPSTDTWTQLEPMSGGARSYAAAALLDGRIYVAGGWPGLTLVECYDPAEDSWSEVAPMLTGRQSPGLVAYDGYLYALGGGQEWDGLTSAERYDPDGDRWQVLPELRSSNHVGCAATVAGGRIFVLGGTGATTDREVESLVVGASLGLSQMSVDPVAARPGDVLTYRIVLRNAGASDLQQGTLVNPIPEHTSYVAGSVTGGASYDEVAHRITWAGGVGAGSSHEVSFQAAVADDLPHNTVVTDTAYILDEACGHYVRTAATVVQRPNLTLSAKSVDMALAVPGDTLGYTIRLVNDSWFTLEGASLVDPIPDGTRYLDGSCQGGAIYDPTLDEVRWQGSVLAGSPAGPGYWEDSDDGSVSFQWIDATDGAIIPAGDDSSLGPYDLGFTFDFCGQEYAQFYVNSNGQILFGEGAFTLANASIPDPALPNNFVATFWDDLDHSAGGAIYYRTYGQAPQRYTVIEWHDVPRYGTEGGLTFEVVLYEGSNEIVVQYSSLRGSAGDGSGATVGLENASGTDGVEYLYNGTGSGFPLHDGLALRLTPPRGFVPGEHSISFAVQVEPEAVPGSGITNTVIVDDGEGATYERQAVTILQGPDLSPSVKLADRTEASGGDMLRYSIRLINQGTVSADDVSVVDPLPAGTSYVDGTAWGGATYDPEANSIRWSGPVVPWSGSGYTWMDSDEGGVPYEWIDATSGEVIPPADDASRGPYPLGFAFTFYDQEYTEFYVNTNGQVLFGEGSSSFGNECIPSLGTPNNYIAAFWDDLASNQGGEIYYATYGRAPDRYAVIAWEGVPRYGGSGILSFEVVLFEGDDSILFQYRSMLGGLADGARATVGIENVSGDGGLQYVCDGAGPGYPLHDGLAVRIVPQQPWLEFGFQVALDDDLPPATVITNTAIIADGGVQTLERSAVVRVNPVNLDLSLRVSADEVTAGEALTYTIALTNSGVARIPAATLWDTVPTSTTYVPGSLAGGATYDEASNQIRWGGSLDAGEKRELAFSVATDPRSPDGTVISNTVSADDGYGVVVRRSAHTTVRSPDLSWSEKVGSGRSNAELTDTLPAEITYVAGSLWASGGEASYADGRVTWRGEVIPSGMVLVRYGARLRDDLTPGDRIRNVATIVDQSGRRHMRGFNVWVYPARACFPLVLKP